MKQIDQQFFSLLRTGLWGTEPEVSLFAGETDWETVFLMAKEQTVVPMVADGVESLLSRTDIEIPREVRKRFASGLLKTEQRNRRMDRLSTYLFQKAEAEGIPCVILKGQGVARCYPVPLRRQSGDVDVVVLPEDFEVLGINDSKKLSDKKRRELSGVILETALAYGFGIKDNHYIDRHNILEATKEAMREAVSACEAMLLERSGKRIDRLLIDAVRLPGTGKEQSNPTKGDQKSLSIAAASIIAKVRRDDMMIAFDSEFPGYDLAGNKGYGTKAHYDGLKKQGLSPIHRKTFLRNLDEH